MAERMELALQLGRSAKHVVEASFAAQHLLAWCRQAVAAGDDALAGRLATTAQVFSSRHKDRVLTALVKDLPAWIAEVTASRKGQPEVDLLGNVGPADATAIGRLACLLLDDWATGLPSLAAGGDAALAKLAALELEAGGGLASAAAIGDGWWTVADKQRGFSSTLVQRHAVGWYRKALPQATGITRSRIEQRLASMPYDVLGNPGAVDMWPLLSLSKGSSQGEWKNVDGALVAEMDEAGDHIIIPVMPFGDYRFEASFTLLSEKGEVMFLIPLMTADGPHSLNYFLHPDGSAAHLIRGAMVPSGSSRVITRNTRHLFSVEVKQGAEIVIAVQLDGHQILRWLGPSSTGFGNHIKARPTRPGALGLGAWNVRAAFHHARFTPMGGRVGKVEENAVP
jgi:hypothetical protein